MTDASDLVRAAIKPLDLSNLLKHAFLSGVVAARNIPGHEDCDGPKLWLEYDPEPNAAYNRILAALDLTAIDAALAQKLRDHIRALPDASPAPAIEEQLCTCGAGHGSLEGHLDWCNWLDASPAPVTPAPSDAPERIWISPVHDAREPDDFYLLHPQYRNGRGTEYVRADLVQPAPQPSVAEAAQVLLDTKDLWDQLAFCDVEAQEIADRIAGPRGQPNRCPDGVQVLEDAETIMRAALRALANRPGHPNAKIMQMRRDYEAAGGGRTRTVDVAMLRRIRDGADIHLRNIESEVENYLGTGVAENNILYFAQQARAALTEIAAVIGDDPQEHNDG